MRLLFHDSATIRAPERLLLAGGRWRACALKVRWGILDHPGRGVVLVDTGYGPRVTLGRGRSAALKAYAALLRPRLRPMADPLAVLAARGQGPKDVAAVIVTHFHADHVAALRDFPGARIHADAAALAAISAAPRRALGHGVFAELLPGDIAARLEDSAATPPRPLPGGLGTGHDLLGDGSLLAVPLPGHAEGHFGIYFAATEPPFLYAADAQWLLPAILQGRAPGGPARLVTADGKALAASAARLRAFHRAGGRLALCHDPAPMPFDEEGGKWG